MNKNNLYFNLSYFRSYRKGKNTAYLLLVLVSMSFALEHQVFFENEVIELVELTEKDKDIKEKKLLYQTDISMNKYPSINNLKFFSRYKKALPKSIYLERQTPPPEFS